MDIEAQLTWLITLAKVPGWKAHAWHRALALDADPSGLFKGIKERLVEAMRGHVSTEPPALTRRWTGPVPIPGR